MTCLLQSLTCRTDLDQPGPQSPLLLVKHENILSSRLVLRTGSLSSREGAHWRCNSGPVSPGLGISQVHPGWHTWASGVSPNERDVGSQAADQSGCSLLASCMPSQEVSVLHPFIMIREVGALHPPSLTHGRAPGAHKLIALAARPLAKMLRRSILSEEILTPRKRCGTFRRLSNIQDPLTPDITNHSRSQLTT